MKLTILKGSYEDKNHTPITKIHISHICVIRLPEYPVICIVLKSHTKKKHHDLSYMCEHTAQHALIQFGNSISIPGRTSYYSSYVH